MQVSDLVRDFELQKMKETETFKEYSERLLNIANKVNLLGSSLADLRIVEEILVPVPERFEVTITTLENTKDMSKITLAELLSALQVQEQRRVIRQERAVENALPVKHQDDGNNRRSKNKKFHTASGESSTFEKKKQQGDETQVANQEEDQLFVATCFTSHEASESWPIDSGCTNHMTHDKELFKELKIVESKKVRIGNGDYIVVKGKGTITITSCSGTKFITDVLYVHDIDQNLLSVGQLIEKGFKVKFMENTCVIEDAIGQKMFEIKMIKRDKLDKKALLGVFIGYSTVAKAYKIFQPQSEKIIRSRDVHFVKNEEWNWDEKNGQSTADLKLEFSISTTGKDENWLNELVDDAPTKGTRLLIDIYARCNIVVCELADFSTTMKDIKWVVAMKEELSMIEKNKTWELVDRPDDRQVIGVKWVYKTKLNVDGSINKHKPRLVVKGYEQVFGMDYSDTFTLVARLDTIRLLLAIAA
ncbi:uncharacterized protein LOC128036024 [Gossypium raimondii]|uniref:uncharacterized protein LOC128036024 n=1 Tax=Gossypium raimondii TaxID=29730 RepID=UPI00227D1A11|nr:uncharacterized protein LOC128036024 [Gossypium raimondii]